MEWYAHTGDKPDKSDWETLPKHSEDVAKGGAKRAAVFGAAEIVRAMGALHDVGKAKPKFQRYLEEAVLAKAAGKPPPNSPGHSIEGAVLALKRYDPKAGKMMAFGIAGHHAGLANGVGSGGGRLSLADRLENADKNFVLPADHKEIVPPAAAMRLDAPVTKPGFNWKFSAPFLIRMLFSCLVDADRTATAEFEARRLGQPVEEPRKVDLKPLRARLNAYLSSLPDEGRTVDAIRREISTTVRANAALDPGLFDLTVPTGGGKTLTSLAFALDHAIIHGMRRVIYVAPFTAVVEQTADEFRKALKDDDAILEHHSAFDVEKYFKDRGEDVEGADGEVKLRRAAESWDRPVIVTTAVQFFESLFSNHPSKCRKLHNIAGSVVILDEAQTIPLPVMRPCLAAIAELTRGYHTSLILCTATQPAVRREDGFGDDAPGKKETEKEGLRDVRRLFPEPATLFERLERVTITRLEGALDDHALLDRLEDEDRWLVIVNSRPHARELAKAAKKRWSKSEDGVFHLSTSMCAAHRRKTLAIVKDRLERKLPTRVVATSLVEAGVDFSFPVVYRAMAGLEAIAQAAGRCNRNNELALEFGPEAKGRVFVFDPSPEDGHRAPREIEAFIACATPILKKHPAPLSPDALTEYFRLLYKTRSLPEMDATKLANGTKGILAALEEAASNLDHPFADIGEAFRLIEDRQVPVIVPFEPDDEPDRLKKIIAALEERTPPPIGRLARDLQSFIVQIPRKARRALLDAGAVAAIRPEVFGDQFVVLTNPALYTDVIGLDWSDPTFQGIEEGIIG